MGRHTRRGSRTWSSRTKRSRQLLYVSTGGFSKDANLEALRANIPITLVNLDDLAALVVSHYEKFDMDGRVLIPLTKIYWPVE
jgi:restriction system protein